MSAKVDTVAYVDEAGARGLSRNLAPSRDNEVGLFCAVLFPLGRIDAMRCRFVPGYERFLEAMPVGGTPHITDAFKPGNEAWTAVARGVREDFFSVVRELKIAVIYDARRLGVERAANDRAQKLVDAAKNSRRSPIKVSDRPSTQRVEESLMLGLSLKLDAYAEDFARQGIDLWFDEIDKELADIYRETMRSTESISHTSDIGRGWDPETKSKVEGLVETMTFATGRLDTKFLGDIHIAGKQDPLVLLADFVANALHYHLINLLPNAYLNRPLSIQGWVLEECVCGVRDDAFEDLI